MTRARPPTIPAGGGHEAPAAARRTGQERPARQPLSEETTPWNSDHADYVTSDRAAELRGPVPDHEPEDKPGSILPGQHRAIEAQLGMLGYPKDDREGRHAEAAALLGLPR